MFWKKKAKTTKEDKQKQKLSNKAEYQVIISEYLSGTKRQISNFIAYQERDEHDGLLYLVNDKFDFKTFFPSRKNISQSTKSVEELRTELRDLRNRPIKEIENPLTKASKIRKLELEIYAKEHPAGEFITVSEDGLPCVEFIRSNSNFLPVVYDINLNCIYIPADTNLKDSMNSIVEKREKYKLKKDKLKGILEAVMWIIAIIFLLGNMYWTYHNWKYADSESSLAKIQERIDASTIVCNNAMAEATLQNVETAKINKQNAENTGGILQNLSNMLIPQAQKQVNVETVK